MSQHIDEIHDIFQEAEDILRKKDEDYNTSVQLSEYFPHGLLSYHQMLHIKTKRIESLIKSEKEPNNESIEDSLLDLLNYTAFTLQFIRSQKK